MYPMLHVTWAMSPYEMLLQVHDPRRGGQGAGARGLHRGVSLPLAHHRAAVLR